MSDCPFSLIEIDGNLPSTDIRIDGFVTHLCPFEDEIDVGTITVRYTPWEREIELHSFADDYLDSFRETKISHEDLTRRIRTELIEWVSAARLTVATEFKTAGLTIRTEVS